MSVELAGVPEPRAAALRARLADVPGRLLVLGRPEGPRGALGPDSADAIADHLELALADVHAAVGEALPALRAEGGLVVILAPAGLHPELGRAADGIADAALAMLGLVLAAELAGSAARALVLCPHPDLPDDDLADAIAWAADPRARHVSGAVIAVDDARGAVLPAIPGGQE